LKIKPEEVNAKLEVIGTSALREGTLVINLLKRPDIDMVKLKTLTPEVEAYLSNYSDEILEQAEINVKYESYIEKEQVMVNKLLKFENLKIPVNFDYANLKAISNEGRQKLSRIRPSTIGQASRISGVSPSDVSVLMLYMDR